MNYPLYLNFDKVPARIMGPTKLPEVYHGLGHWVPFSDRFALMTEALPITEPELKSLVYEWDASLMKQPPSAEE